MDQQKQTIQRKKSFYNIFKNNDPFGRMFNNCINQKILLCQTDGYYLKKEQFEALMKTIKKLEESSFYISVTENNFTDIFEAGTEYIPEHWKLSSQISYEEYKENLIILENALYSINGVWGVIVSHEDHAVLGGSDDFIELFKKSYKNWNQDIKNFNTMWEYNKKQFNSDTKWIPDFLEYIES